MRKVHRGYSVWHEWSRDGTCPKDIWCIIPVWCTGPVCTFLLDTLSVELQRYPNLTFVCPVPCRPQRTCWQTWYGITVEKTEHLGSYFYYWNVCATIGECRNRSSRQRAPAGPDAVLFVCCMYAKDPTGAGGKKRQQAALGSFLCLPLSTKLCRVHPHAPHLSDKKLNKNRECNYAIISYMLKQFLSWLFWSQTITTIIIWFVRQK